MSTNDLPITLIDTLPSLSFLFSLKSISIKPPAGGLIEIDLSENKKDKDGNVSIRVMGKSFVDIQTEPAESNSKSKDVSIRVLGKKVVDINTDDWIQVDREDKSSENS